jgi:hypothetical protein
MPYHVRDKPFKLTDPEKKLYYGKGFIAEEYVEKISQGSNLRSVSIFHEFYIIFQLIDSGFSEFWV